MSRPDGCADLTITVSPHTFGVGRQSTYLTVSAGAGNQIRVQIISENGTTRANVGPGN